MWVRFLGSELPWSRTWEASSIILAWEISCMGTWWTTLHAVTKTGRDQATEHIHAPLVETLYPTIEHTFFDQDPNRS